MKQLLFLLAGFTCIDMAVAQKGIRGLVNAERRFAEFTATHTVKEGFLKYMDSAGVIFRQGVDINAMDTYKRQTASPGVLSWEPVFAVISASGDMGITTGPYEFRLKPEDTATGRGTFFSIWRISRQGEWKVLADFGTGYTKKAPEQELRQIVLSKTSSAPGLVEEIIQLDKKFNRAIQEKNMGAWMPFISSDSRFNMDAQFPATGMLQIADAMQKVPAGLIIATKTGELSAAGDLAYTYGMVANGPVKNNYLRAWIYRNGQWQVIAQTLKW
ncbi:nuclear transport factor 2 family protein [Sediminibacterium soli]|uniref:nuclear transport factor 2 family protein n=1 Tax=Sediminibacterium soli TaxID=2698829 RepID=UPI0013796DA3|nr:nuclear transport factor 2 family protein [Sediminibacterium soli]NCI47830.1 nuclear transport factor 2 family protein [Sediminibacterium soli]